MISLLTSLLLLSFLTLVVCLPVLPVALLPELLSSLYLNIQSCLFPSIVEGERDNGYRYTWLSSMNNQPGFADRIGWVLELRFCIRIKDSEW